MASTNKSLAQINKSLLALSKKCTLDEKTLQERCWVAAAAEEDRLKSSGSNSVEQSWFE